MRFRKSGWTHRLRELPPAWPWADGEEPAARRRWLREPEPYEERGAFEPYPGATVLEDLDGQDEAGSVRILARYATIRVMILASGGTLAGEALRTERRIARQHLALLPGHDWERHALDRLAGLSRPGPEPGIADAAIIAAESAAKRGHSMGAFALYRAAWDVARDNGWWDAAARAARGISRLARLDEAAWSTRLWGRRAAVAERRAAGLTAAPAP
jgi:hypothetical protein